MTGYTESVDFPTAWFPVQPAIKAGKDAFVVRILSNGNTMGFGTFLGGSGNDTGNDIAVFRDASGLWAVRALSRVYFGGSSDDPVPGDYNGSGSWSPAVFRPSSGLWAVQGVTRGYFGGSTDEPVPADYSGTGADRIGIFRPSSGLWAVSGLTRIYYGTGGDLPVIR